VRNPVQVDNIVFSEGKEVVAPKNHVVQQARKEYNMAANS